jgi:FMN phosphatase YigB (HAD superfamily)
VLTDARDGVVCLLDVDNTLLDNDAFSAALDARLTQALGDHGRAHYRTLYETVRAERGYADYQEPLQRMRRDFEHDRDLLRMSTFLLDFAFDVLVYPGALEALRSLAARDFTSVILSDGDVVFQPRKVQRSGLWAAVAGRVLIYIHKEKMLDAVERCHPARRYVMIDDKLRVLAAMKDAWRERVVTVFPRQGHYAHDPAHVARYPAADVSVERVGDLLELDPAAWLDNTKEIP